MSLSVHHAKMNMHLIWYILITFFIYVQGILYSRLRMFEFILLLWNKLDSSAHRTFQLSSVNFQSFIRLEKDYLPAFALAFESSSFSIRTFSFEHCQNVVWIYVLLQLGGNIYWRPGLLMPHIVQMSSSIWYRSEEHSLCHRIPFFYNELCFDFSEVYGPHKTWENSDNLCRLLIVQENSKWHPCFL